MLLKPQLAGRCLEGAISSNVPGSPGRRNRGTYSSPPILIHHRDLSIRCNNVHSVQNRKRSLELIGLFHDTKLNEDACPAIAQRQSLSIAMAGEILFPVFEQNGKIGLNVLFLFGMQECIR